LITTENEKEREIFFPTGLNTSEDSEHLLQKKLGL
jgi:hypothetical protein